MNDSSKLIVISENLTERKQIFDLLTSTYRYKSKIYISNFSINPFRYVQVKTLN